LRFNFINWKITTNLLLFTCFPPIPHIPNLQLELLLVLQSYWLPVLLCNMNFYFFVLWQVNWVPATQTSTQTQVDTLWQINFISSVIYFHVCLVLWPRIKKCRSFLSITPFKKSRSGVWPPIKECRSFLSITPFKKSRSGVWPPIKKCRSFLSITPFKKSRSGFVALDQEV